MASPILELSNVSKAYGGLRPLRVRALSVMPGSVVGAGGLRSDDGRGVRQPGHRRDAAGRGRRACVRPGDLRDRRQRRLARHRRSLRHRQRAGRAARPVHSASEHRDVADAGCRAVVGRRAASGSKGWRATAGLDDQAFDDPWRRVGVALRHRVRLARALATSPAVLLIEHPVAGLEPHEIRAARAATSRARPRSRGRGGDYPCRGCLDRDPVCDPRADAEWRNWRTDGGS